MASQHRQELAREGKCLCSSVRICGWPRLPGNHDHGTVGAAARESVPNSVGLSQKSVRDDPTVDIVPVENSTLDSVRIPNDLSQLERFRVNRQRYWARRRGEDLCRIACQLFTLFLPPVVADV